MDPVSLAVAAFIAIAGGIAAFAKQQYDSDPTTEGTTAYYNKKQLDLANSQLALNEKVSQENLDLSKEQFNYQKQLNDTLMQREDTAYQRQIADLKAAGLSPLMVSSGGASAAPLTSANAPQRDISGVNQAMTNAIGAYNDIYNRKLARQQFAMQSKVQSAQAFATLLDTQNTIKKSRLENEYLNQKLEWEKTHGFRDLSLSSELLKILEDFVGKKDSNTVVPGLTFDNLKTGLNDMNFSLPSVDEVVSKINGSDSSRSAGHVIKYPTKKEIVDDVSKINKAAKEDYTRSMNILQTRQPTKYNLADKKYMSAVTYVYRHTDAWRRFENTDEFINALKNDVFRKDLQKTYPYKNRSVSDY